MGTAIIRDNALWANQIEGDPAPARRIRALPVDARIVLRIEGHPIRFRKMNDDKDEGVKPQPDFADVWRGLQARDGETLTVEAGPEPVDPYLLSLAATLTEWNSPEDAAAYDGL